MNALSTPILSEPSGFPDDANYELLWANRNLQLYASKEGKFLNAFWSGIPDKSIIMEGCEQLLVYIEKTGFNKVINDVSKVEGLFTESVDWVISNFAPRLNESGVTHVAWIYAEKSVSRFSADFVLSRSITDTIAIVFDNLENAERWIKAV